MIITVLLSAIIIDQFGRKRCQKKRNGLQTSIRVFQKYFVVHERSAVKNSFSTYVWSKEDSFISTFCMYTLLVDGANQLNLYLKLSLQAQMKCF